MCGPARWLGVPDRIPVQVRWVARPHGRAVLKAVAVRGAESFSTSSRHPPRTRGARGSSPGPALLSSPRSSPAVDRTPTARVDGENRGGSECSSAHVKTMPPAGAEQAPGWRGRRTRVPACCGERGEAPIPSAVDPGEPSRHGSWRPGRSSSWALHLDARTRACSTHVWVDGSRDGSRGSRGHRQGSAGQVHFADPCRHVVPCTEGFPGDRARESGPVRK